MNLSNPILKINGSNIIPWLLRLFCIIIIIVSIYNFPVNQKASIIIGIMFLVFFSLVKRTSLSVFQNKLIVEQVSIVPFMSKYRTFNYEDIERIEHLHQKKQPFLISLLLTGFWMNKDERIVIYKSEFNFKILKLHFNKKHVEEIISTVNNFLIKNKS